MSHLQLLRVALFSWGFKATKNNTSVNQVLAWICLSSKVCVFLDKPQNPRPETPDQKRRKDTLPTKKCNTAHRGQEQIILLKAGPIGISQTCCSKERMDEPEKMRRAAIEPSQHWVKTKNNRPKAKFGGTSRDTQISMALSSLLRHQASNVGIRLDSEGFAPLDQVLKWGRLSSLTPTVSDIHRIVVNCEKQRFEMKPNPAVDPAPCRDSNEERDEDPCRFLIRANQGHSIAVKSDSIFAELDASTLPPRVLHGTFFWAWPRIVESGGLRRMGRQHIHCATGMTEDNVVGMRRDAEVVIDIDVEKALEDGIRWFRSKNGYILTEGDDEGMVPLRYFKEARGRLRNVGVLVKDGEIVAGLPAGFKASPPFGKATGGFRYAGGKGKRKGRTQ